MGLIVDNFAGGGGASLGIEMAMGRHVDIAINHDPEAIAMHKVNHPFTKHYCEDVWDVDPIAVTHGQPVDLAWFSPDCTHHSKARGDKPKNQKIRGLAWVATKWAAQVYPKIIILENVEEFQDWGPIGEDGKPIKKLAGETFNAFVEQFKNLGYSVEWRELRACDYGAPTTRKRLFLVAKADKADIRWPEKTHGPGRKYPYHAASEIIDWSIPCQSIFGRKKPLCDNTMRRIHRGVMKFVINNTNPFYTITAIDHNALISPVLIQMGYGDPEGRRVLDLHKPLGTITAQGNKFALAAAFLKKDYGTGTGQSVKDPLHTITAKSNHFALVQAFLMKYYGGGGDGQSLRDPLHTITAKDRFALVTVGGEEYGIADIGMRMLQPRELFSGNGFPSDYIIDVKRSDGKWFTKADKIHKCGNAVVPQVAAAVVSANVEGARLNIAV